MAPPQLAADAPVLDVVEPLEVGGLPVVGHEADATGFDRIDRGPGDRMQPARTGLAIVACLACQIDKPLVGQVRLDDRTAADAARPLELVVVDLVEATRRGERTDERRVGQASVSAWSVRGPQYLPKHTHQNTT